MNGNRLLTRGISAENVLPPLAATRRRGTSRVIPRGIDVGTAAEFKPRLTRLGRSILFARMTMCRAKIALSLSLGETRRESLRCFLLNLQSRSNTFRNDARGPREIVFLFAAISHYLSFRLKKIGFAVVIARFCASEHRLAPD